MPPVRPQQLLAFWQEGQRHLATAEASDRPAMERVADELVLELRRRLGGPFTLEELATLYLEQGIDWCYQLATRVAPRNPSAWDLNTVAGAAYARYAREATDYRGRNEPD